MSVARRGVSLEAAPGGQLDLAAGGAAEHHGGVDVVEAGRRARMAMVRSGSVAVRPAESVTRRARPLTVSMADGSPWAAPVSKLPRRPDGKATSSHSKL